MKLNITQIDGVEFILSDPYLHYLCPVDFITDVNSDLYTYDFLYVKSLLS